MVSRESSMVVRGMKKHHSSSHSLKIAACWSWSQKALQFQSLNSTMYSDCTCMVYCLYTNSRVEVKVAANNWYPVCCTGRSVYSGNIYGTASSPLYIGTTLLSTATRYITRSILHFTHRMIRQSPCMQNSLVNSHSHSNFTSPCTWSRDIQVEGKVYMR